MVCYKLFALVKVCLVKPVQVREVNLEPAEPALTERLFLAELEQAPAEVVPNMVQVWRDRIRAASEVEVVWEVQRVAEELKQRLTKENEHYKRNILTALA